MPIIEPAPEDAPLTQGDILKGIRLFCTGTPWTAGGGVANEVRGELCLVVSRPCVAAHKPHITVAAIERYSAGVPGDVKTLDEALDFLECLRGGVGSPDQFYLGEIPEVSGRLLARLDSFHDVQVPVGESERAAFVRERRVGRLQIDFARDLHVRLFCAFAALGFDDLSWYSTDDLVWIVEKARSELSAAQKDLHDKRAADSQQGFHGKRLPPQEIVKAESRVKEVQVRLTPLENELEKRKDASGT